MTKAVMLLHKKHGHMVRHLLARADIAALSQQNARKREHLEALANIVKSVLQETGVIPVGTGLEED